MLVFGSFTCSFRCKCHGCKLGRAVYADAMAMSLSVCL